ncbi:hypothetical protein ES703_115591 [subsurface metagenome]
MAEQYVTRIHRQHTTVVTSIPKGVQSALELTSGEYLVWQVDRRSLFVQVSKVVAGGKRHDRGKGDSDKKDRGRRARAKAGARR